DVGRIVLQVGIHDHHPPALRRLEPGVGRRRLTAVHLESHQTHPPVGLPKRANDLRAPVAASVVDEHNLEGEPEALEHLAQLGPEWGEAGFLVVDGDDDRDVSHPAPPSRHAIIKTVWSDAMATAVLIEHGAITLPVVRNEAEAIEAPISRMS